MLDLQDKFSEADKLFDSATALLKSGEYARAATILLQITQQFENYGKAWCELGKLMMTQLEDFPGATDCFKKAIEVSPAYAPAYISYAEVLFNTEKYAEMNAILNQAIEISGVRKDLVLLKNGLLMESQQRFDEAIETYKKALMVSFSEDEILKCENGINRCNIKKKYL